MLFGLASFSRRRRRINVRELPAFLCYPKSSAGLLGFLIKARLSLEFY